MKKYAAVLFVSLLCLFLVSCSDSEDTTNTNTQTKPTVTQNANVTPLRSPTAPAQTQTTPTTAVSPSPVPSITPSPQSPTSVKTGKSTGIVTKINMELGTIELDHDDVPGMMPPMIMEFYVKDKNMLNGLKIGDKVSFVLEDRGGQEQLIELKRL